jgi:Gluconate 2-dehydrogenase subunit 3
MQRRQVMQILGSALAIPLLPRSADAALDLADKFHRRLATTEVPFRTLNPDQRKLVTMIAEMIIPETDTPGATSVKVPEFIDLLLSEWSTDDEKSALLKGLADIDAKASAMSGTSTQQARATRFIELAPAQRVQLLTTLDAARGDKEGAGLAFGQLKTLTVYGYFTSQAVQQKVLKTRMFFDSYQGNVPFTPAV